MSKFNRFLFTIPIFIVIFSLICCPVYALSNVSINMPISQPNVSSTFGYIEVVTPSTNGGYSAWTILVSYFTGSESNNVDPFCRISISGNRLRLSDRSGGSSTYMSVILVDNNGNFVNKGNSLSSGYIDITSSTGFVSIIPYGPFLYDDLASYNTVNGIFIYGSDSLAINYLGSILSVLRNQSNADIINNANQNAQDIQNNADQNAEDIQNNADQNAQNIIENQNDNNDKIIENENNNHDETLNGWESPGDSPSDKEVGDLSSLEDDLIGGNQEAADNASAIVNDSFLGSIQRYASGFSCVSKIFGQFLSINADIGGLVWFSLAMGVVPLIVGSTIKGLKANDKFNSSRKYD